MFPHVGITTVAGSAKSAVLIVDFVEERMAGAMDAGRAAVGAAKLRLRPILTTSSGRVAKPRSSPDIATV